MKWECCSSDTVLPPQWNKIIIHFKYILYLNLYIVFSLFIIFFVLALVIYLNVIQNIILFYFVMYIIYNLLLYFVYIYIYELYQTHAKWLLFIIRFLFFQITYRLSDCFVTTHECRCLPRPEWKVTWCCSYRQLWSILHCLCELNSRALQQQPSSLISKSFSLDPKWLFFIKFLLFDNFQQNVIFDISLLSNYFPIGSRANRKISYILFQLWHVLYLSQWLLIITNSWHVWRMNIVKG